MDIELMEVRGGLSLLVERDWHFKADTPVSAHT